MPSTGDFAAELERMLRDARTEGLASLVVTSGELHRRVGGYPGPDHRMPACCSAMKARCRGLDRIIVGPPSGHGATLKIEYNLQR